MGKTLALVIGTKCFGENSLDYEEIPFDIKNVLRVDLFAS
jgi:hypothetical protein